MVLVNNLPWSSIKLTQFYFLKLLSEDKSFFDNHTNTIKLHRNVSLVIYILHVTQECANSITHDGNICIF